MLLAAALFIVLVLPSAATGQVTPALWTHGPFVGWADPEWTTTHTFRNEPVGAPCITPICPYTITVRYNHTEHRVWLQVDDERIVSDIEYGKLTIWRPREATFDVMVGGEGEREDDSAWWLFYVVNVYEGLDDDPSRFLPPTPPLSPPSPPPVLIYPAPRIGPGNEYNGGCTMNFVYDGVGTLAGRVFVGVAAHCTVLGEPARTTHIGGDFGVTVYDNDENDVAFVEVEPAFFDYVDPSVVGYPDFPRTVATAQTTAALDRVVFSGYGMGYSQSQVTRENRTGFLLQDGNEDEFSVVGPVSYGDSGGPVVHVPTGGAYGSLWHGTPPAGVASGPTVTAALASAAAAGLTLELRTVSP